MCVKFYSSRVCRTHKNFQLFTKLLLKVSFFAYFFFFGSLKTRDNFLPTIKLSLNCHQQNFINAFFKKMTVKYNIYLNKKLLKNRNFQSFNLFLSKTKYFIYVQLFLNSRFLGKFNVTVHMV